MTAADSAQPGASPPASDDIPNFYRPGEFQPDQSVGYLMRRVLNSVLAQADAELAVHELTYVQWLPLYKLLRKEGDTVADLARSLNLDPGAMTRSVDRLEAKGLVLRERSATDRRVVHLVLTEAGRALADEVQPVLVQVLNRHLKGFSEAEWLTLLNLLQRMLANGDANATPRST